MDVHCSLKTRGEIRNNAFSTWISQLAIMVDIHGLRIDASPYVWRLALHADYLTLFYCAIVMPICLMGYQAVMSRLKNKSAKLLTGAVSGLLKGVSF